MVMLFDRSGKRKFERKNWEFVWLWWRMERSGLMW